MVVGDSQVFITPDGSRIANINVSQQELSTFHIPEEYEEQLIEYENNLRKHIQHEQQLKLHIEAL